MKETVKAIGDQALLSLESSATPCNVQTLCIEATHSTYLPFPLPLSLS